MILKEIINPKVAAVSPSATVLEAAQLMDDYDLSTLIVADGKSMIGVLSDHDITVEVTAKNLDPAQMYVQDIMRSPFVYAFEDSDAAEISQVMRSNHLKKIAVLTREKRLLGLVSLEDIARATDSSTLMN